MYIHDQQIKHINIMLVLHEDPGDERLSHRNKRYRSAHCFPLFSIIKDWIPPGEICRLPKNEPLVPEFLVYA